MVCTNTTTFRCNSESDRRHHEAVEPIRSVENYFSLIDISAIGHVKLVCVNVELERSDPYQPRCFSSHPSIPNYRYYRWDGLETWHLVSLLHRKFGEALGPLEQPLPASTSLLLILTSCPACSVEEFRQQDTREHPYLQANPNWRRVYKDLHARPEVDGYREQGRTHPGISMTQHAPPGSYIDTRIVIYI